MKNGWDANESAPNMLTSSIAQLLLSVAGGIIVFDSTLQYVLTENSVPYVLLIPISIVCYHFFVLIV